MKFYCMLQVNTSIK